MHPITNNTFKVMMRMKTQVVRKKRVRSNHPLMTRYLEEEEEESLPKFLLREDLEDLGAKFQARKNRAMMRKRSKILMKNQETTIVNGRTDAIFVREPEACFAVMDAHR